MRQLTQEEKELIVNKPITKECFEMGDFENMPPRMFKSKDEYGDIYEENNLCNFISLDLFWCDLINVLEDYRVHYNEIKDERYFIELVRLLPNSYKVVKLNNNSFDSNKPAKHMGANLEYVFRQLCEAREIIVSIVLEYESRKGHAYSTVMRAKELLNKGVFNESY